jgi:hypothetical protein
MCTKKSNEMITKPPDDLADAVSAMQAPEYDIQPLSRTQLKKLDQILLAVDIAEQVRPDVTAYDDSFDFRPSVTGVRPVLADVAVSNREQVLVSHAIIGSVPSASEIRLIAAALEKMEN